MGNKQLAAYVKRIPLFRDSSADVTPKVDPICLFFFTAKLLPFHEKGAFIYDYSARVDTWINILPLPATIPSLTARV